MNATLVCRTLLSAVAMVVATSIPARAQEYRGITGSVRDSLGRPLAGAEVRTAATFARSDSSGRFVVSTRDDSVSVLIRKVGYEPTRATLHRERPDRGFANTVTLLPLITRLDRVVVEGVAYDKRLWDNGFYRRQHGATGVFFDPADVRFLAAGGLNPLLRAVPRLEIVREQNQDYAYGKAAGRACRMHVWINRVYQREAMPSAIGGDAVGLRDLVDAADVVAVEVYASAVSVPTEFTRGVSTSNATQIPSPTQGIRGSRPREDESSAPCGAIVIWTR